MRYYEEHKDKYFKETQSPLHMKNSDSEKINRNNDLRYAAKYRNKIKQYQEKKVNNPYYWVKLKRKDNTKLRR